MLSTILTSIFVALVTSVTAYVLQEKKLRTELRTEFMAEQAARKLLESKKWKKRSFDEITHIPHPKVAESENIR